MLKLTNKQLTSAALSYAQAYAYEIFEDSFREEESKTLLQEAIDKTSSIKTLLLLMTGQNESEKVEGFYKAMKKVIPHMDRDVDDVEYNGTEDRGWYRVWESAVHQSSYFSAFDLGRDVAILLAFYEANAITKEQYEAQRIRNTLGMASEDRWMTNGRPDAAKMVDYFKPEWLEKCLDLQLVYGFKMAEHASASTAALLTLIKG